MNDTQQSLEFDLGFTSAQWAIFNVDQGGFYRVRYDSVNYGLIRDQLLSDHTIISVDNRAQLLDDAFNLAILNKISYTDAFDLTRYLGKEVAYSPWHGVLPELDYIHGMFLNNPYYGIWRKYIAGLVTPYFKYVGFLESASDAHLTVLSRSNSVNWACRMKVPECTQNATANFNAWLNNPTGIEIISRHQKSVVLCAAMDNGSENDWENLYQRFLTLPADSDEGDVILSALGCTSVGWLQARLLEVMIKPPIDWPANRGPIADGVRIFNAVAGHETGNRVAFNFLLNSWSDLSKNYTGSLPAFFQTVSTKYNTQLQLNQLTAWRDQHADVLGSATQVSQAIQTVQDNIKWVGSNLNAIIGWLKLQ